MLCLTVVYCHLLLALPVAPDSAADTLNSPVNATSVGITYRDIARPENTLSNRANSTRESTHSLSTSTPNEQWFDIWQRSFTDTMDFTVKQLDGLFESSDEIGASGQKEARGRRPCSTCMGAKKWHALGYGFAFQGKVRLPALKERVDLLLSDNEDETQNNTIRAARDTGNNNRDRTTIALRFRPEQDSHYSFESGAGHSIAVCYCRSYCVLCLVFVILNEHQINAHF